MSAYRATVEDDDGILHVYAAVEAVTPEIQATLSARRIIIAPSNQALKNSKHYRPMVEIPLVKIGRQVSFSRDVIFIVQLLLLQVKAVLFSNVNPSHGVP